MLLAVVLSTSQLQSMEVGGQNAMSVEVGLQGMCFDPALGTQRDNAFPSLKFPVYLMREILY